MKLNRLLSHTEMERDLLRRNRETMRVGLLLAAFFVGLVLLCYWSASIDEQRRQNWRDGQNEAMGL